MKATRKERVNNLSERNQVIDPYIYQLLKKLKRKNIRYQTILLRCEEIDKNQDSIIHISDLEEILIDYLGIDNISRREVDRLGKLLVSRRSGAPDGGLIDYRVLEDLFDQAESTLSEDPSRNSRRGGVGEAEEEFWYNPDEAINYKRGSIGEMLYSHSCPAERKNFRSFILCLEEFERISGMKATPTEDGFIVPLGPDLKATINFSLR